MAIYPSLITVYKKKNEYEGKEKGGRYTKLHDQKRRERKGKKGKGVCVKIRGERGWKVEKNERVTIETREKGIKASIYRGSG